MKVNLRYCIKFTYHNFLFVQGNSIQKRKDHSCNPDISRNLVLKEIVDLKERTQNTDIPVPQIYDDKLSQVQISGVHNFVLKLPPFPSVSRVLYGARNKANDVTRTTFTDVESVVVPLKFRKSILADYYDKANRIIVFCFEDARKNIENIKEIFIDGTFSSCPRPFVQLYIIHGDVGSSILSNNVRPLYFALMTDKKTSSYYILFNLIKSQLPAFKPNKVHCDYEKAPINALRQVYPDIVFKGCFYHWSKSVWKKAKLLGHTKCKGEKRIIELTAALPLIPQTHSKEGWQYIKSECLENMEMSKFITYIESFWMKPNFSAMLCVFGEHHRTNNISEGWNAKLNKSLNKNTVTLLRLLNVLEKFQKITEIKLLNNTNNTKRTKRVISNDDFILHIQMQLINNEITVGHALDKLR